MSKLTHIVSSFALIGVTWRQNKEVRPKGAVFYHRGVEVWSRFRRQAMQSVREAGFRLEGYVEHAASRELMIQRQAS